jgi:hypothetical protein
MLVSLHSCGACCVHGAHSHVARTAPSSAFMDAAASGYFLLRLLAPCAYHPEPRPREAAPRRHPARQAALRGFRQLLGQAWRWPERPKFKGPQQQRSPGPGGVLAGGRPARQHVEDVVWRLTSCVSAQEYSCAVCALLTGRDLFVAQNNSSFCS